jgi:ABC-2 type transport system ATP-binding protein
MGMLRVENLHFYYGPRKVLDGLSFTVPKGKLVGFLGPNGAGKTTTMNLITGACYASEGEVFVNDVSMRKQPLEAKKHVGFLPEYAPLYQDMVVSDYLQFICEIKGVSKDKHSSYVHEAIEKTKLGEVQGRLISRLSKGFRQRVGVAQALVHKPDLIVLDEPTVGFDPQQVNEFKKLLRSLRSEHTVLWSTHILADVEDTCDEIILIRSGQIITQGVPSQIQRAARGSKELILTVKHPSDEFLKQLLAISGVVKAEFIIEKQRYHINYSTESVSDEVLQLAAAMKVGVVNLESDRRDLESLFLELTK